MTEDYEGRLTRIEERSKSNSHRIEAVEKQQKELSRLVTSVATMAQQMEQMKENIGTIRTKVEALAAGPGKRWDAIVDKVLLGIVAALVAYALSKIGL